MQIGTNKKINAMPHPRHIEFMRLSFFWSKLGLNKFDLANISKEWQDEIYLVSKAIDEYRDMKQEQVKNTRNVQQSYQKQGKRVEITKLL